LTTGGNIVAGTGQDICISGGNCLSNMADAGSVIDGTGATNRVAYFTDSNTLASSALYQSGNNIGIGASPLTKLDVSSGTSGDSILTIRADTDNSNEEDNPGLVFLQDGNIVGAYMGMNQGSVGDNDFVMGITYASTNYDMITFEGASRQVGIGDITPDGSLKLDVEGSIGATQYCDETGANCIDIANVGTGDMGGSGTVNYIPLFSGATTLANSVMSQSGTTVSVAGDLLANGGDIDVTTGDNYHKFGMWGTDSNYGIGMYSARTYGGLNDYAMTFTMNADTDRGFLWRDSSDVASDGAMSLTTDGVLTLKSNLYAGSTGSTADRVIRVVAGDAYKAGFEAYGSNQGTGYMYVGQSTTHGGGISYNGDGSPAFVSGETADRITFFRRNASVDSEVFSYSYSSDGVAFNGAISALTVDTGSGAKELGDAAIVNGDTNSIPTSDQVYDFVVGQVGGVGNIIEMSNPHVSNWNPTGVGAYAGGWHGSTGGANGYVALGSSDAALNLIIDGDYYAGASSANKVWHAGNDGAGSGLDADLLDGVSSGSFLRSDTTDYLTSTIYFRGDMVGGDDGYRDHGVFGNYDSTKTDHIWSMGTAYRNAADGSNFGNLYGLAYKHTNNPTGGTMAGGHQMVWVVNGGATAAMGQNGIWTSGDLTAGGGDITMSPNALGTQIADTFAGTTQKSYIHFVAGSGSNDPGYIMHETRGSESNEGVLHLAPSDDNAYGDYVSIHGSNDPDMIKLHTDGTVEGVTEYRGSGGNVIIRIG
jgi:hypothetical protein